MIGRKNLVYLAVDPSLRHTGLAAVWDDEAHTEVFGAPALLRGPLALASWMRQLAELLDECGTWVGAVDVALVEGYAMAAVGSAVTSQAEVGGIARAVLAQRWPVVEVPPGTWRALTVNRFGIKPEKGTKAKDAAYLAEIERWFHVGFYTTHEAEAYLIARAADVALNDGGKMGKGGQALRDAIEAIWRVKHGQEA